MPGCHCAVRWATTFIRKRAVVFCLWKRGIASRDRDTRFSELSRYTRSCRSSRLAWERSTGKDNNSPRLARYRRELYVRRSSTVRSSRKSLKNRLTHPVKYRAMESAGRFRSPRGKTSCHVARGRYREHQCMPFFSVPATSGRGFYSSPSY